MKQIIITYNLKDGITPKQFEDWVKTTDQPNMRSLKSVTQFRTFRTEALLMGEGKPSHSYVEIFDINDFDSFTTQDMAGEIVQKVMQDFMGLVENPQFIIAREV